MSQGMTITERTTQPATRADSVPQFTATDGRRWLCDWQPEVFKQLDAIRELPPGWDSDGARRPDERLIVAGWYLLVELCRAADLPKPHINPTRVGGVQFEWDSAERYFEIEVVAERAANFFYCDDAAGVEEEGELDLAYPNDAVEYIQRVQAAN